MTRSVGSIAKRRNGRKHTGNHRETAIQPEAQTPAIAHNTLYLAVRGYLAGRSVLGSSPSTKEKKKRNEERKAQGGRARPDITRRPGPGHPANNPRHGHTHTEKANQGQGQDFLPLRLWFQASCRVLPEMRFMTLFAVLVVLPPFPAQMVKGSFEKETPAPLRAFLRYCRLLYPQGTTP